MSKLDYVKKLLNDLTPEEQLKLDEHLIGNMAKNAEKSREQHSFVLSSEFIDEARILRDNWGKMQGISSGYKRIDALTLGFVPGELIVVAGSTSQGKTALAVNMTAHIIMQNRTALFVTLEMTKPQLTSRMMYAVDNFEDYAVNLAYQHTDELNWQSIDGLINKAVKELGVEIVVIDHLHYFTRELDHVAEDLGRITKELKKNAIRHNIPIVLISHVRKTEKNKQAGMEDLRGSSYIAQDADIVLMVSRDTEFPSNVVITCCKNRNRGIIDDDRAVLEWDKTKITEGWT